MPKSGTSPQGKPSATEIDSTPSFRLGPTGGTLERVEIDSLAPDGITPAIEEALNR